MDAIIGAPAKMTHHDSVRLAEERKEEGRRIIILIWTVSGRPTVSRHCYCYYRLGEAYIGCSKCLWTLAFLHSEFFIDGQNNVNTLTGATILFWAIPTYGLRYCEPIIIVFIVVLSLKSAHWMTMVPCLVVVTLECMGKSQESQE